VLLAVPSLVASGVLNAADQVYGSIGPAFYGLRTTLLTLLFMALWRIKRPEGLRACLIEDLPKVPRYGIWTRKNRRKKNLQYRPD
jgi:hypothetical protein